MTPDEQIAILYVPCGSEDEATKIASALLSERLIACANVYTSRSLYRWEDKMADETEYVMFAKTTQARAAAAEKRAEELHSYEIPCILTIHADSASGDYARWVMGEVKSMAGKVELAASTTLGES